MPICLITETVNWSYQIVLFRITVYHIKILGTVLFNLYYSSKISEISDNPGIMPLK